MMLNFVLESILKGATAWSDDRGQLTILETPDG